MGRRNRVCYLCGETYQYCPTCYQDRTKPSWMAEFHSKDCVKIFDICTRFNMGTIPKAEAREALKACDLSNKENFKSCVKRDLEVIFAEDPKPKRTKKAEPIVTDVVAPIEQPAQETHEVVFQEEN